MQYGCCLFVRGFKMRRGKLALIILFLIVLLITLPASAKVSKCSVTGEYSGTVTDANGQETQIGGALQGNGTVLIDGALYTVDLSNLQELDTERPDNFWFAQINATKNGNQFSGDSTGTILFSDGTAVHFNGYGTGSINDNIVTGLFSVTGSSAANSMMGSPSFDVEITGTYSLEITKPPFASFDIISTIPKLPMEDETITFDASSSSSPSPSAEIVSYHWEFDDESTADGKIVTHSFSEVALHNVSLTITDSNGIVNTNSEKFSIYAKYMKCLVVVYANFTFESDVSQSFFQNGYQSMIYPFEGTFIFNGNNFNADGIPLDLGGTGSISGHAEGTINGDKITGIVSSTLVDNEFSSDTVVVHWSGPATGVLDKNVMYGLFHISKNYSKSSHHASMNGDASFIVWLLEPTVPPENLPPVPSFLYAPSIPTTRDNITFDASSSTDTDGTIISYQWDFGDGISTDGLEVRHQYQKSGTYEITLTVIDDDGVVRSAKTSIECSDAPSYDGTITLDQSEFTRLQDGIVVRVTDPDMNVNPEVMDSVSITLQSYYPCGTGSCSDIVENFALNETFINSGEFVGTIKCLPPGAFPSNTEEEIEVSTSHPGRVVATYIDQLDAQGNVNQVRSAEATTTYNLSILIFRHGYFVSPDQKAAEEAHFPITIGVVDTNNPTSDGSGYKIFLESDGVSTPLGETNQDGLLNKQLLLNEDWQAKLANKEVSFTAQKTADYSEWISEYEQWGSVDFSGETEPAVYLNKTQIRPTVPIVFDANTITFYYLSDAAKSFRQIYRDPLTYCMILLGWIIEIPIIIGSMLTVLSTMAFMQEDLAYQPSVGDTLYITSYSFSSGDISPAYNLEFLVDKAGGGETKWEYWSDSSIIKKYGKMPIQNGFSIFIHIGSPVRPYITAPDGSHAGYDPQTGEYIEEFPIIIGNITDEPLNITIPYVISGDYKIDLTGTESGIYHMNVQIVDFDLKEVANSTFTGTTEIGKLASYNVLFVEGKDPQIIEDVNNLSDQFQFYPGWNFISVPKPLQTGYNTAGVVFANVNTDGKPIWTFNASSSQWETLGINDELHALDAYWVYSTKVGPSIQYTYSTNTYPNVPPVKHLEKGWNAIGIGSRTSQSPSIALGSLQNKWDVLLSFDNGLQMYWPPIVNGDQDRSLIPGQGYWIYIKEPGDLASTNSDIYPIFRE
jgi:hypothetical protein